ncbi:TonB-dependent receptor domain-containing protein [Caulobacter soli]|uniref:TonB-dependent receptor domain-containing protein n=1 Tax=Caulobacter soli TaxID=2708539 RepID=UPI0013E9F76F|nr:TonB-dependent receptor [Caulobacter soli]
MHIGLVWAALAAAQAAPAVTPSAPQAAPQKPAAEASTGVSAVEVKADAPQVRTSIDRRSYSISSDLSAQSGAIADALRNIPSVEVDVQGNVSLRGDPSVTILIDGKPSSMFQGDGRGQALQQMPADRIDRVEVSTNPSAEFRADGTGGVINLITKKAKGAGRTSSLRLTIGDSGRGGASGSIGYNGPKLSASGDLNYRRDTADQVDYERRRQADLDSETQGKTQLDMEGVTGQGSVDYDVSDKLRLGGEARLGRYDFAVDSLANTAREDGAGAPIQAFRRDLSVRQRRDNGMVGANLRRRLSGEGHELSLKLSYDVTDDNRVRTGHTIATLPAASSAFDQQRLGYDIRQTDLKGDYVRPMGEGRTLKLGFDLQFDDNSYVNRGFRGASLDGLTADPLLNNRFLYEQTLSQAYATYERPLGDLTVLAGLRYEKSQLDLAGLGRETENDTADWLPSLHLSYPLGERQKLTASYSERLQRPTALDMNPVPFLQDPLNYRIGNPNLKPQETRSFELGWQYRKAPLLAMATLYYRQNDRVISDLVTDIGGGVFVTSRANVVQSRNGGLELVLNGKLNKALTYNVSSNLFWAELDGSNLGLPGKRSATTASGRASLSWQATAKDLLQVNGFLTGKRLTAQGYAMPSAGIDLGYRRKIDDRLSVVVTVQDVLGLYRDKQVIETPALKSLVVRDIDARLLRVGLAWTFGTGKARKDPGFDFQGPGGPPQ